MDMVFIIMYFSIIIVLIFIINDQDVFFFYKASSHIWNNEEIEMRFTYLRIKGKCLKDRSMIT